MRIIAFYSPKGGVGKTAAAVNTAYLASRDNLSTLLWDLDPQGASSFYLAGAEPVKGRKLSKLLEGKSPIARFIHEDVYPNLDFIPAHSSFRNFDIKLEQEHDGNALKDLLAPLSEDTSLRSEEHTSELQSRPHLVCRLLLEKKKNHAAEAS